MFSEATQRRSSVLLSQSGEERILYFWNLTDLSFTDRGAPVLGEQVEWGSGKTEDRETSHHEESSEIWLSGNLWNWSRNSFLFYLFSDWNHEEEQSCQIIEIFLSFFWVTLIKSFFSLSSMSLLCTFQPFFYRKSRILSIIRLTLRQNTRVLTFLACLTRFV